jgi:hypothetical protein
MTSQTESKPPSWLPYHPDFQYTMSGAHRKPAYEIGAPSITWHLGIWKPPSANPEHKTADPAMTESESNDNSWIRKIEELILHIFDQLTEHCDREGNLWELPQVTNLQPSWNDQPKYLYLLRNRYLKDPEKRNEDELRAVKLPAARASRSRYEAVHINAAWQSMPVDIRFETSSEFFTITTTIDFSRMRPQRRPNLRPEEQQWSRRRKGEFNERFAEFREVRDALYEVINQTSKRYKGIYESKSSSPKNQDIECLVQSQSSYLFFDVWKGLRQQIFECGDGALLFEQIGKIFADFRNLSLQYAGNQKYLVNPWEKDSSGFIDLSLTEKNPWEEKPLYNSIQGHKFAADDGDDLRWVDAIHPILLSIEPDIVNRLGTDPVEYTFTKFCHNRCIYGSGFGPQVNGMQSTARYDPKLTNKFGNCNPLTYLLLFGFEERRQMGRLVNRLNTLGTLRLAAIRDLRLMKHNFSYRLDDIEQKLVELQTAISEEFQRVYGGLFGIFKEFLSFAHERRREKVKELLRQVHYGLDSLDCDPPNSTVRNAVVIEEEDDGMRGWIPGRAQRSIYFRKRFERLAQALNSSPIEGYQPYRTFVAHRLYRAFHIIRLVSERYTHLRRKELRLRREWISLSSVRHEREIQSLQSAGEVFFFLFLVPYYISHTIDLAVKPDPVLEANITKWLTGTRWLPDLLYLIHVARPGVAVSFETLLVAFCCVISCSLLIFLRFRKLGEVLPHFVLGPAWVIGYVWTLPLRIRRAIMNVADFSGEFGNAVRKARLKHNRNRADDSR